MLFPIALIRRKFVQMALIGVVAMTLTQHQRIASLFTGDAETKSETANDERHRPAYSDDWINDGNFGLVNEIHGARERVSNDINWWVGK